MYKTRIQVPGTLRNSYLIINQSVNWDVLIPLLNNKPIHSSIQQR